MPQAPEQRIAVGKPEVRSVGDGGARQIAGYAAVFNREAVIAGNFRERIAPGAFRDAIGSTSDVRALFNHNASQVLGRTQAGTLRLAEDEIGLRYEIDLNADDPEASSIAAKIQRGDVTGSSFRFLITRDGWDITAGSRAGELPLRTITRFTELLDVGPVTFPAYDEATAEARDMVAAALATITPPSTADDTRAAMTASEGEEAAELVQYQTAAAALTQANAGLASAMAIVTSLVTAETTDPATTDDAEAAEEELETAQLRALLVLCLQICGAVSGVSALAQAMLSDEYDPILYARSAAVADGDRARRLRLAEAIR